MSEPWRYWRPVDATKFLVVYAISEGIPAYPGKFVIHRWRIRGDNARQEKTPYTADSLEEARRFVPPGLMQLEVCLIDPKYVVEIWM